MEETRKYEFKSKIEDEEIDYVWLFSFISLKNLTNATIFQYRLVIDGIPTEQTFNFKSKAIEGKDVSIFLMGDHDLEVG